MENLFWESFGLWKPCCENHAHEAFCLDWQFKLYPASDKGSCKEAVWNSRGTIDFSYKHPTPRKPCLELFVNRSTVSSLWALRTRVGGPDQSTIQKVARGRAVRSLVQHPDRRRRRSAYLQGLALQHDLKVVKANSRVLWVNNLNSEFKIGFSDLWMLLTN